MKKFGLLIALFVGMLSCTIEDSPDTSWDVVTISVKQRNWSYQQNGQYYTCSINMPELTSYIYNNGLVQVYYEMEGSQQLLPYVRHNRDQLGQLWTTTLDYEYQVGRLNLFYTNSDFIYTDHPGDMKVRVVLIW